MLYSYLDDIDDNPDFAIALAHSELELGQARLRRNQLRRRLDGRSRGLLELVRYNAEAEATAFVLRRFDFIPIEVEFFSYKVDFLHRTVRDFLYQSAEVANSLQHVLGSENCPLTACHAILAEMKTAPFDFEDKLNEFRDIIHELFFFISASLTEYPGSEAALWRIMEAAETSYKSTASRIGDIFHPCLFIGLAAQIDFFSYVRAKLVAEPNILQSRSDGLVEVRPALDFALKPARYPRPRSVRGGIRDREKTCELIRVLLLHGADLNAELSLPRDVSVRTKVPLNKSIKAKALVDELLTPGVENPVYQEMRQAPIPRYTIEFEGITFTIRGGTTYANRNEA
ncbi:hypothetical protein PG987_014500 [Apiospora arundinis]